MRNDVYNMFVMQTSFPRAVKAAYLPEHVTTKLTDVLVTSAEDTFKILLGTSLCRAKGRSVQGDRETAQISILIVHNAS